MAVNGVKFPAWVTVSIHPWAVNLVLVLTWGIAVRPGNCWHFNWKLLFGLWIHSPRPSSHHRWWSSTQSQISLTEVDVGSHSCATVSRADVAPGEQSKNNRLDGNCQGVHKDTTLRKPKLSQEMFFFFICFRGSCFTSFFKTHFVYCFYLLCTMFWQRYELRFAISCLYFLSTFIKNNSQ